MANDREGSAARELARELERQRIAERERNDAAVAALFREHTRPDHSALGALDGLNSPAYGSAARTRPAAEAIDAPHYGRMADAERRWRTPEGDYWSAAWIKATTFGRHDEALHAEARLVRLFGASRAVLEEGIPDASGGFGTGTGATLLPRPLEMVVYIARDRDAKMRRFASFYPMTSQEHNIPTAGSMTAAMVAEGSTAAEGNPVVSQVPLLARKAQTKAVAGRELFLDSAYSMVNMFATRGGGALAVLEDDEFFRLGSGTAPHVSRMTGTAFTETSSAELKFSDVQRMYRSVPQVYRKRGIWLVASDVLSFLQNVRDGQGRQFYTGLGDAPEPITDDPGVDGMLLRKPVYEAPWSNGEIWFGDVSAQYAIGQRQGIELRVSEHALFASDQVMWLITERIAGVNVDSSASQYCTGITSATTL